ncbi:MAG: hypothetical protein LBC87_10670 [Fibromonadaceae bacterium]|jgi:hypothetical protein|nr:hypothetical protein [Fibromonadaceae bacterium]
MKIVSKITLAATFGLALAFTFSCSDDDKGGWLTCEEFKSLATKCISKYEAEKEACRDDWDCLDGLDVESVNKCVMPDGCNGTDKKECEAHYESEGCYSN